MVGGPRSGLEPGPDPDIIAARLPSLRQRSDALELLEPLLNLHFAIALAITCLGGFTFGFAGFGGGLTMTPLLALLYGPAEAIFIANLVPVAVGAVAWPGTLPHVRWREVVPVMVATAITAPVGVYLLFVADPGLIRRAMGLIVFVFAGLMIVGWTYRGPRNLLVNCGVGGVGGLLHGSVGMGGTCNSLYFLSVDEASRVQRANLIISLMTQSAVTIVPLLAAGAIDGATGIRSAVLALPYAAVLLIGGAVFRRTSDIGYRRVAVGILVAVGVIAMAS